MIPAKKAGRISPYTCPHSKNAGIGNVPFQEILLQMWFQKYKISLIILNFYSTRTKIGASFLFTFPHPSPNGMSVWVNSPWACKIWLYIFLGFRQLSE
jgi:hypothetical protein